MSQSTAPGMCPTAYRTRLTSTSTMRTRGSSRWSSSHSASTSGATACCGRAFMVFTGTTSCAPTRSICRNDVGPTLQKVCSPSRPDRLRAGARRDALGAQVLGRAGEEALHVRGLAGSDVVEPLGHVDLEGARREL